MVEEAGVKVYLNSWGTQAVVDNGKVQGIIFESKSGRQAILGKVIIDSTGDGDLLPSAGVEFDARIDPKLRIANLSLVFWLGNVDLKRAEDFKLSQPEKHAEIMKEAARHGGHPSYIKSNLKNQDSMRLVPSPLCVLIPNRCRRTHPRRVRGPEENDGDIRVL